MTDREISFHMLYMSMAELVSKQSRCNRRKVGCLIVADNIITYGFNGTPSGFNNDCEDSKGSNKPEVLHAEANAIAKYARNGHNNSNPIIYITTSPCIECSKQLIQLKPAMVIYKSNYHCLDGIKLLEQCNIPVLNTRQLLKLKVNNE